MLRLAGGAVVGFLVTGCGQDGGTGETRGTTASSIGGTTSAGAAGGAGANARGIAFNTASKDVTLFDTATNRVTDSRPTGAVVRWLSNEQHY